MIETVFRDRYLWVVDKPCGLPVQGTRRGEADLYTQLRATVPYLGLHHRLDQPASGLVLLTLAEEVNADVARLFREHQIARSYLAVLFGDLDAPVVWDRPIEGQPATTRVEPLTRARGLTVARISLETGRKHQIRVHAALAGLPLVGDRRYGEEAGRRWPRLALHAARLALLHPHTGAALALEAPVPPDLSPLLLSLGSRD